jgi:hypothetical protein
MYPGYGACAIQERAQQWLVIGFLIALICFSRPTGVIVGAAAGCFVLFKFWKYILARKKLLYGLITAVTALLLAFTYIVVHTYDFEEQLVTGNVITYMDLAEGKALYRESGMVDNSKLGLAARNESAPYRLYYFLSRNSGFVLKTALFKVWYLVAGMRPYYSFTHNAFAVCWILAIYFMFFVGIRNAGNLPVKVFVTAVIILNCALVALLTVDWDNRFFIPMEPGIVLMAGGGVARLLNVNFLRI